MRSSRSHTSTAPWSVSRILSAAYPAVASQQAGGEVIGRRGNEGHPEVRGAGPSDGGAAVEHREGERRAGEPGGDQEGERGELQADGPPAFAERHPDAQGEQPGGDQ